MTWEELVTLFISYQQAVHVVRGDGLDAISLQLAPVAWFVSIKSSGGLNFVTYEGDDLRLVGSRTIPLMELEPGILRREIEEALEKQIVAWFDPSAVGDFLKRMGGRRRFCGKAWKKERGRSASGADQEQSRLVSGKTRKGTPVSRMGHQ